MPAANPWKSYRQVATQTAPPGQLILMLFDGALKFLDRGLAGFGCADPAKANMTIHNNFQRALDIVRELNRAVNLEQGGECAETFRRLYDYFELKIVDSIVRKNPEGVREVVAHLTVMRDAWATMLAGLDSSTLPAEDSPVETAPRADRKYFQATTYHLQPA